MKLCKNCKFYRQGSALCLRRLVYTSSIDGSQIHGRCGDERGEYGWFWARLFDVCGLEGRFYEVLYQDEIPDKHMAEKPNQVEVAMPFYSVEGPMTVWSQEGGYADPSVRINGRSLTGEIEEHLKKYIGCDPEYPGEIGLAPGIWRVQFEQIKK